MQPRLGVALPATQVAPPYPAELVILSHGWSSRLARDGVVYLSKPEVHLGLLATNDVVLRHPHVSRLHAVIRWTPAGYEIEDLGSTDGTYVDRHRVVGRMTLAPGATIRIGTVDMRFQPVAAPPEQTAVPPAATPQAATPQAATPQAGAPPPSSVYMGPPSSGGAALGGASITARPSRLRAWMRRQAPKRYWRVFLLGLLAYSAADLLVNLDLNRHAIPLVILLASALVPVTFVIFCWEEGAFADMPATIVGLTFVSGAVMGLLVAGFLEDLFLVDVPLVGPFIVGIIEEGAKAAAVIWFLRDSRLRSELDGLVLGAAAGMGFATLETAGYGFSRFLDGYTNALTISHASSSGALSAGIASMTVVLILRMALAIFGHGAWTAIVCAAIWRERGPAVLRITGSVALAFFISVTLHALWDSVGSFLPLSLLLWPIVAFSGLWVLRFFIHEAVGRAKLGSLAPPPPPLVDALWSYLRHPWRRPPVQALYRPLAMDTAMDASMGTAAAQRGGAWSGSTGYPPSSHPPAPHAVHPAADIWQSASSGDGQTDAGQPGVEAAIVQPHMAHDQTGTTLWPDNDAEPPSPQPAASAAVTAAVGVPGRMCPNGHFVSDATRAICPECNTSLPGMPPSNRS